MRLADAILRRGHLSDQALAELCVTGNRPTHLDQCELCAERAVEFGRWLDDVRTTGIDAADAEFPQERLAAQQAQILRRLEHLDNPARVIAFPGQARYGQTGSVRRRITPAWIGVAAAAGLVLGVLGTQFTARLGGPNVVVPAAQEAVVTLASDAPNGEASARVSAIDSSLADANADWPSVPFLEAMDQLTPHAVDAALVTPRSGGRR